eukprot:TRINITY_DN31890_c0_g1_i1.p1 TRINITY_DN31890_c0_g1~~TRINITY_DN31890_c0_g1_i1.p1  ORF type:complete len:582 (+),score=81.59 TRINITY_DN31890_c0_g1_i1:173-1747(+)
MPFRCQQIDDLKTFVQSAPWGQFLEEPADLGMLPISALERESKLDVDALRRAMDDSLVEVAARFNHEAALPSKARKRWFPQHLGIRAVLEQDICSLELNCGSRLGMRPFLQSAEDTPPAVMSESGSHGVRSWSLRPPSPDPSKQEVSSHRTPSRYVDGAYVAALVRHLNLQGLMTESQAAQGLVVWDPFCRSGGLLLEILSDVLGLSPRPGLQPCSQFKHRNDQDDSAATNANPAVIQNMQYLTVVGSDRSPTRILEARELLQRFCCFYGSSIPAQVVAPKQPQRLRSDAITPSLLEGPWIDDEHMHPAKAPVPSASRRRGSRTSAARKHDTGERSRSTAEETGAADDKTRLLSFSSSSDAERGISLPCEVSLNVASFEVLGPYLSGALIATHVPNEVHALGPTGRLAHLYRQFGHFIASRKDWLGVFVLTDSKIFRRQSRLSWRVLERFSDHAGRKWQLLHWTCDRPHGHSRVQSTASKLSASEGEPHNAGSGSGVSWQRAPRRRTVGRQRFRPGRLDRPHQS